MEKRLRDESGVGRRVLVVVCAPRADADGESYSGRRSVRGMGDDILSV